MLLCIGFYLSDNSNNWNTVMWFGYWKFILIALRESPRWKEYLFTSLAMSDVFEHIAKKKIKQVIRKMDFSMMMTKIPPNEANETKTWLWTFCFLTKQWFVPYRLIWELPLPHLKYHFSPLPLKRKQLMTRPTSSKPKFFYLNHLLSLLLKVDFPPLK